MIDFCYAIVQKYWKSSVRLPVYRAVKLFLNIFYPLYVRLTKPRGVDPASQVIVSLTTFPARIDKVHLVIQCLLRQTLRPGRVQLWLAEEQFPDRKLPEQLLRLERYGLEICYCDDLRSHKKYYYAMQQNPEATVVTADDDTFYPESWLQTLVSTAGRHSGTVVCMLAHQIQCREDGNPIPYAQWPSAVEGVTEPRLDLMPVGCEGVLYPPHVLYPDVYDKSFFMEACRNADDLWLKTMSLLQGVRVMPAVQAPYTYANLLTSGKGALSTSNVGQNENDRQLQNILARYPQALGALTDQK